MVTNENETTIEHAHDLNISAVMCPQSAEMSHFMFSGSRDYSVKGWDVNQSSKTPVVTFQSPRNIVTALAGRKRDSSLVYQGSEDLCVRVWDIRQSSNSPVNHITGYVYFPLCMSLQEEGNIFATGCKGFNSVGCGVLLWDLRNTAKPLKELKYHSQDITSCHFLPDNQNILISASKDGSIVAWDVESESPMQGSFGFPKKWLSSMVVQQKLQQTPTDRQTADIIVGALDGSVSILEFAMNSNNKVGSDQNSFQLVFATQGSEIEHDDT
jgi:WD40 repeat protein